MPVSGKVVIVTGASRGIGKAAALGLAREGAKVVVAARSETERSDLPGTIHATVAEIESFGGAALAVRCNMREEADIYAMVRQTMDTFGRVDALVNNAAVGNYHSFLKTTLKEWDLVMDIDLRAPFICCKAVAPIMVEQKSGSIINISSQAATNIFSSTRGRDADSHIEMMGQVYGTVKAGLERFSWGLATELGRYNIAVNTLLPMRPVVTEGFLAQRPDADYSQWVTPEAMTKAVIFLVQQDASGLTGTCVTDEELVKRNWL